MLWYSGRAWSARGDRARSSGIICCAGWRMARASPDRARLHAGRASAAIYGVMLAYAVRVADDEFLPGSWCRCGPNGWSQCVAMTSCWARRRSTAERAVSRTSHIWADFSRLALSPHAARGTRPVCGRRGSRRRRRSPTSRRARCRGGCAQPRESRDRHDTDEIVAKSKAAWQSGRHGPAPRSRLAPSRRRHQRAARQDLAPWLDSLTSDERRCWKKVPPPPRNGIASTAIACRRAVMTDLIPRGC